MAVILGVSWIHFVQAFVRTSPLYSAPRSTSPMTHSYNRVAIFISRRPRLEDDDNSASQEWISSGDIPNSTNSTASRKKMDTLFSSNTAGSGSPERQRRDHGRSGDEEQQFGPRRRNRSARRQRQQNEDYIFTEGVEEEEEEEETHEGGRTSKRTQRRHRQRRSSRSVAEPIWGVLHVARSTISALLPDRVQDIGSLASRMAKRKTQQFFDELVMYTFDEEIPNIVERKSGPSSSSRKKRQKRIRKDTFVDDSKRPLQDDDSLFDSQNVKTRGSDVSPTMDEINETWSSEVARQGYDPQDVKIPLHEILSLLDDRDVVFSPKATREELEVLFRSLLGSEPGAKRSQDHTTQVEEPGDTAEKSHMKQKVVIARRNESDSVRTRVVKANRKAQTGATRLLQDSPGTKPVDAAPIIVDAVVENFSKRHGGKDTIYQERWTSPYDDEEAPPRSRIPNRSRKLRRKRSSRRYEPTSEFDVSNSIPQLPPSQENTDSPRYRTNAARSARVTGQATDRRIYSPYRNRDIFVDGLDHFGDLVAKTVDSLLWGDSDDEMDVTNDGQYSNRTTTQSATAPSMRGRSGNWKDRMEEQFDFILGIHQDGKYYNRWFGQEFEDDEAAEGTDAVSFARGLSPSQRRKRRIAARPPWEERDSLLGVLFGVDDRSPSFVGSGSILKILQILLRSCAILVSGVCRWASVRGTLPKPIVVVSTLSALLCSRPGGRVRNFVLSLVAVRALGELLHGYMYNDDDFWDPSEEDGAEAS
jgi:hypothetical protein